MTTRFGTGIAFRKAQVSAKFHCPTSTVTLFSEYGEGRIRSFPVIESQKRPANSSGIIVYNYPCYVRRRGWMPRGLLSLLLRHPVPDTTGIITLSCTLSFLLSSSFSLNHFLHQYPHQIITLSCTLSFLLSFPFSLNHFLHQYTHIKYTVVRPFKQSINQSVNQSINNLFTSH